MTGPLSRLIERWRRPVAEPSAFVVDLSPFTGPIYAIGDVHGCAAALRALLSDLRRDAENLGRPCVVILLGDVIDRGDDSAGVLDHLTLPEHLPYVTSVLGNHEQMMLAFLDAPRDAAEWLDLGGYETLRSYGLSLTRADVRSLPQRRLQQMLEAHIPEDHVRWLRSLPHAYRARINGEDVVFAHAGWDGSRADADQSVATLLWGRGQREIAPGLRLVQGHVIVDAVELADSRLRIDTGAWRGGRLTAIRLLDGHPIKLFSVQSAGG